jgi:CubicO group peptidase (beta-lactamase class C family)
LSGTLLVSQDEETLFEQAYGFASRQLNVPNRLETKFPIASVTKMFIAMAALILVEQGRISLQEQPCRYLPALAALDQDITIQHLLSHTSGLEDMYEVPNLVFERSKLKHEGGDLLSYLVQLPQLVRPGEGWRYSSTDAIVLGYLMEQVTGVSFDEVMKRYVLTPLAMTNTGHDMPQSINPGRASGPVDASAPGISKTSTPQYGYGWFLAPRFRMHGGGTPGFLSRIWQYPEQKISIILLWNSDHVNPETILGALEPLLVG